MECAGEDKIVVYGELVQAVVEVTLVNETAGFVDDNEAVDHPGVQRQWGWWWGRGQGTSLASSSTQRQSKRLGDAGMLPWFRATRHSRKN